MEEKKQKRVLTIELDDNVKKVSITGLGDDETVVMKQELSEEELEQATGGMGTSSGRKCHGFWHSDLPLGNVNGDCHTDCIPRQGRCQEYWPG